MSSVLVHNGGVLVANGSAIAYEGGGGAPTITKYYGGDAQESISVNISGTPDIVFFHGWRYVDEYEAETASGWARFNSSGVMTESGGILASVDGGPIGFAEIDPDDGSSLDNVTASISNGVLTLSLITPVDGLDEYVVITVEGGGASSGSSVNLPSASGVSF